MGTGQRYCVKDRVLADLPNIRYPDERDGGDGSSTISRACPLTTTTDIRTLVPYRWGVALSMLVPTCGDNSIVTKLERTEEGGYIIRPWDEDEILTDEIGKATGKIHRHRFRQAKWDPHDGVDLRQERVRG